MSEETKAIIPLQERDVDFYGDRIVAALVRMEGREESQIYVPLRPVCEYMGLSWSAQFERIQRDPVLAAEATSVRVTQMEDQPREMVCLPIEFLHGWLFGISVNRVKEEMREKVIRYQRECYRVLWEAFQADALAALGAERAPGLPEASGPAALLQIRQMGLAIASMAEQQLALESRVSTAEDRLDKAARVFSEFDKRLSTVEDRLDPGAYITDAGAAKISTQVKALAGLLTEKDPSKNHYQAVFGELYRRYGVASYKHIRQEQLQDVLEFLEDWRRSVGDES